VDELITQMNSDCQDALAKLQAAKGDDAVAHFPLGRLQAQGLL
jgi:hypothetical protein